jgi:hypothetical protein
MSKEKVGIINDRWIAQMKDDNYYEFFMYEPFTDQYWSEKYKVIFCNINAYGVKAYDFQNEGYILPWNIFEQQWSNSTTIRRTLIFTYYLLNKLRGVAMTEGDIRTISRNKSILMETAKRMTYMNLQKEIGRRFVDKQERDELLRFYFDDKWNSTNQKDLIEALEPDIVIFTGTLGLEIMNKFYMSEMNIAKHSMALYKNTLFVHLFHPSTSYFSYDYIIKKVNIIENEFKNIESRKNGA